MSWWKRLHNWWRGRTPAPPDETNLALVSVEELEDDPDVKQVKKALDSQIIELLRVHPEAAPRVEEIRREAEREASRWMTSTHRLWVESEENLRRERGRQAG